MKTQLIALLRRLLYWLSPDDAAIVTERDQLRARLVPAAGPVWDRVQVLTAEQDAIDGRSGEAKRHQVLARLLKDFPDTPTLTLSKLIDAAVEARR
jgi:hypothetical protein